MYCIPLIGFYAQIRIMFRLSYQKQNKILNRTFETFKAKRFGY